VSPARVAAALLALGLAGCGGERPAPPGEAPAATVPTVLGGDAGSFARITGPRPLDFPFDHGPHPDYRIEWWYLTGAVEDERGRPFGFQVTFFRYGLVARPPEDASVWFADQLYMAHAALTDVTAGAHRHAERLSRPGPGLAGALRDPLRVWVYDWRLEGAPDGGLTPFTIDIAAERFALELDFASGSPLRLQGDRGYSRKGRDPGNASRYYSLPRLPVTGRIRHGDADYTVSGTAWLDREWGTSTLDPDVVGWDWLSLRLGDGRDLMLYRLRQADGSQAPYSAGSLGEFGETRALGTSDFTLEPLEHWQSPETGARYPVVWRAEVPGHGIDLIVEAAIPNQEMRTSIRYWEGLVRARDRASGQPAGEGYLELTGYDDVD
jgi:predicted secreted hydrolase